MVNKHTKENKNLSGYEIKNVNENRYHISGLSAWQILTRMPLSATDQVIIIIHC